MNRTITVKGVGKVSAKPDYVVLSMNLESRDEDYEKAMNMAANSIDLLNRTLSGVGFEKEAVKTTNFYVRTDYDSVCNQDGSYERVFRGYVVSHDLKLEFDFDTRVLTKALSAVGSCLAHPQLNVLFTVKDPAAISEEMLTAATVNARRKAQVLCEASGVKLGTLLSVDYHWEDRNVFSNTRYGSAEDCLAVPKLARAVEIQPEDIHLSDSAIFVWEIE